MAGWRVAMESRVQLAHIICYSIWRRSKQNRREFIIVCADEMPNSARLSCESGCHVVNVCFLEAGENAVDYRRGNLHHIRYYIK